VATLKLGVTTHKDGEWYVAIDSVTDVTSQGKSVNKALKNFQEAFELWLENVEEWKKEKAIKREPVVNLYLNIKSLCSLVEDYGEKENQA
jgi:predicted RNase H-like HicB family nuclease